LKYRQFPQDSAEMLKAPNVPPSDNQLRAERVVGHFKLGRHFARAGDSSLLYTESHVLRQSGEL